MAIEPQRVAAHNVNLDGGDSVEPGRLEAVVQSADACEQADSLEHLEPPRIVLNKCRTK
jgi:hypothetical protein